MVSPLFLAHGSPMMAIEDNECALFLQKLGRQVRPKAIVLFTAHWESDVVTVSSSDERYETIYDFGGFPRALFETKYPARGSSEIADEVVTRFERNGIPAKRDYSRGLDHGSWVVLSRLYPEADIPVVQISVNPFLPAARQFEIGAALAGLGEQDVLVIGSGATVHNLRALNPAVAGPEPWAVAFDDWLIEHMQAKDYEALSRYAELAPNARAAVPRAEHFVPLYIAMGAGGKDTKPQVVHRSYEMGTLSYLCVSF